MENLVKEVVLKCDPERDPKVLFNEDEGHGITGIFVRAMKEGKLSSVDLYELDYASLMAWLRSRGGDNPWAENTVAILLGHDPQESASI
jgi:hypothetical protein